MQTHKARRLLYVSMMRMPTEKAHGLQITQNCEAFAQQGWDVQLWVARRFNAGMRHVRDPYAYYGVTRCFDVERVPCVDLMPLAGGRVRLSQLAFYVQMLTYVLVMLVRMLWTRADLFYSRDEAILYALSWIKPRASLVYEAHLYSPTARGAWLQSQVCRRVGTVVAITPRLRDDLIARGADPVRTIVAHDGYRAARFVDMPERDAARDRVGWPREAFIVGFVGRLHMIGMDKGVGTLVEALASVPDATIALVGGPDDMAEALRQRWLAQGLDADRFLYAGHVPADQVPSYLRAFDVCAMPHPYTEQFAFYTSPLKLFEYMAAERAVVASDLPGWADVAQHEHNALLVPPGDAAALAVAIQRLKDDPDLRQRLAAQAGQDAQRYTWSGRAALILNHAQSAR